MIYIHVPFCRSFCTYCGFYSEVVPSGCNAGQRQQALIQSYIEGICKEIRDREDEIRVSLQSGVDTLYFGGGTPSVLKVEDFKAILDTLGDVGVKPHFEEFTIEMNPEDVVQKGKDYINGLVSLGLNRVSMGLQSFDDSMLKWMNRRHSSQGAVEAVSILRDCGISNISLDLIFGISHLTDRIWEETIDKTLSLSPEHISAYQLSIEDGSALEKLIERGQYEEADENQCLRQYNILCKKLSEAGYQHYEVSNFCKPDKRARHNSAYWKRVPYIGLGPGAHSYDGDRRFWNSESAAAWTRDSETLSEEDKRVEHIMLELRTAEGIDKDFLERSCDGDILGSLLMTGSLICTENGRIRIPEEKFFTSDSIIRELI